MIRHHRQSEMSRAFLIEAFGIMAVTAVAGFGSMTVGAQVRPAATSAWDPPRTPDNQPDIQGVWRNPETHCDLETGFCQEENQKIQGSALMGATKALRTGEPVSAIIDPSDGKIPYQAWAAAKRQEILRHYGGPKSLRGIDPQALCFTGAPRLSYSIRDFQIIQTPGYVTMIWEWQHTYRVIPLDRRPRVPEQVKLLMGDARGHWKGNTLIIETRNFNDWTWLDSVGTIHSDAMSAVERFTFVDSNTINYQVTIEDPKVFTKPWTLAMSIKRRQHPFDGYEVMEDACIEGNARIVRNMLHGQSREDNAYSSPGRPRAR
jgi:hypothetical protein